MPANPHTKKRLGTGIRSDSCGIEAYINVAGDRYVARFPRGTPLKDIKRWREDTRARVYANVAAMPIFSRTLSGWCYVYALASPDGRVKVGKAIGVSGRHRELEYEAQCKLQRLMEIPAHATVERAIHRKFAHLALGGEWFTLTDELRQFLTALARGANPIALLWDVTRPEPSPPSTP